jgi:hypothetical protein
MTSLLIIQTPSSLVSNRCITNPRIFLSLLAAYPLHVTVWLHQHRGNEVGHFEEDLVSVKEEVAEVAEVVAAAVAEKSKKTEAESSMLVDNFNKHGTVDSEPNANSPITYLPIAQDHQDRFEKRQRKHQNNKEQKPTIILGKEISRIHQYQMILGRLKDYGAALWIF